MFINEVISYKGAWEELNKKNPSILQDIKNSLNLDNISTKDWIHKYYDNFSGFRWESLESNLSEYGWKIESDDARFIYITKNSIGIHFTLDFQSKVIEDLYFNIALTLEDRKNLFPIIITDNLNINSCKDASKHIVNEDLINEEILEYCYAIAKGIEHVLTKISILGDLTLEYPFLILGIDNEDTGIKIHEIKSKHDNLKNDEKINRCITFAPEYYQAGLSILNYFGTVLRNKYPEQKATVKIEQHENMVRMIVESENGGKDIIEKALYEYELVMSGQTSVEDFYQDPIQTLELRNQIRMMQFQVESQREIVALKNGHIQTLQDLLRQALKQPQAPITVNSYLTNQQTVNINHKNELNHSYS